MIVDFQCQKCGAKGEVLDAVDRWTAIGTMVLVRGWAIYEGPSAGPEGNHIEHVFCPDCATGKRLRPPQVLKDQESLW